MRAPARLRLVLSVVFFPLAAVLLALMWQRMHPEGLWRKEPPSAAAEP